MFPYRWIHALAVAAALAVVGVVSLSDTLLPINRAMNLTRRTLGRATANVGTDIATDMAIPIGTDTIGHFIIWAMIGLLAAGLCHGIRRLNLFLGLFALSALIEVGQRHLSWSRSAELSDLVANGVGLGLGFIVVMIIGFTARTGLGVTSDVTTRLRTS